MTGLLGLPLDRALERYRALGSVAPRVLYTAAPRRAQQEGTLRVVRVRPDELTVAYFPDRVRQEECKA